MSSLLLPLDFLCERNFLCEPERCHFAEYLTGLLFAVKKKVFGINSEFAVTTDQSCLNHWMTQSEWEIKG